MSRSCYPITMPTRHPERQIRTELDRFAALIAQDHDATPISPSDAAFRMGKGSACGNAYMQRLRKEMGAQAV